MFLFFDNHPLANFLLLSSFGFILLSSYFFIVKHHIKTALVLLFLSGIASYLFAALLDPFLNIWDEQYHALVAKNLINHPLIPTLIDKPVIEYDYRNWCANYVWLHKQPLFLWQIALSLKLFGINELAVRLPGILMMSIIPLFIYRMGKLAANQNIGFIAAVLFVTSNFSHELLTGFRPSDQNDVAFLFYVSASIWAWTEYNSSNQKKWVYLIGIFVGCAVLVKWLPGLLVFAGWGISIITDKENRTKLLHYKNILIAFFVSVCVFLPWQLYILFAFPLESKHEYAYSAKHFTEVIEGHGGDAWYYFSNIREIYGAGLLVPFIIIVSFFFLYKALIARSYRIVYATSILFVYLFFTLAKTKMFAFCFIISPLIFISLASLIEKLFEVCKNKFGSTKWYGYSVVLILTTISIVNINHHRLAYRHTDRITTHDNDKRSEKINDTKFVKSLPINYPGIEKHVVFNCKSTRNIAIMFYHGIIAYDQMVSNQDYEKLKGEKIKIAVIDNGKLPEYLSSDLSVLKIIPPDTTWH